jgi:hypothetical protein
MTKTLGIWLCVSGLLLVDLIAPLSGARVPPESQAQTQSRSVHAHKVAGQVAAEEERAMSRAAVPSDKSWLLEQEVYNSLSGGGRIAARFINGRYKPEAAHGLTAEQQTPAAQPAAPGQNINLCNVANGGFGKTQSETSIAVNGTTIVESFNDNSFFNQTGLSAYSISTDGGASFSYQKLGESNSEFNLGDGVVAFGPGGELYYSEIALNPSGVFIAVGRALDGIHFNTIADASTTAANSKDFQDKPWIAVDRSPTSPFRGNVYVSWTDFTHDKGTFIDVAASTNRANTFGKPVAVTPKGTAAPVQGSVPAVAPNGDLYVAYFDGNLRPGGISIVKSSDGGSTFSSPRPVAIFTPIGPMTGGQSVRTNSFPSMSIDGGGNIHIAFNAQTVAPGPDRSDIYYVRSTDGGNTFSKPLRINDDNTSTSQFFPSVVATSTGTVGIKWWDRRNDPINDVLTDVYMSISTTGGASFGPNFRITDHNWAFGPVEQGLDTGYHGDYDGITTDGTNFYLAWSDERGKDPDAYFTFIPVNTDPVRPDFNISATRVYDSAVYDSAAADLPLQFELSTSATNGFSGSLSLTATAIGGSITPSFNFDSTTVPAGGTTTLTLTPAQPGDSLITVTATGGGISRSTNLRAQFFGPTIATHTSGFTTLNSGLGSDSSAVAHIAFDDDTGVAEGGRVYYMKSNDGGRSYSTPVALTGSSDISFNSALAVDPSDNIYIAWTGLGSGLQRILVSRSTDHGATFSAPTPITPPTQDADLARIAGGPGGTLTCSYMDFSSGTPRLLFTRSTDGGLTFSTPFQVSLAGEVVDTLGHSLVADRRGNAFLAYVDDSVVPVVKFAAFSGGLLFARGAPVSDPSIPSFAPEMAVDQNGAIALVYYSVLQAGQPSENREVMFSKSCNIGGDFSPPLNVSLNRGQSRFPTVMFDHNSAIFVAWEDTTDNDQQDILWAVDTTGGAGFITSSSGDTRPTLNLSKTPGFSTHARLATDQNNNVIAIWSDDSAGESDLFAASIGAYPAIPPAFHLISNDYNSGQVLPRGTRAQLTIYIGRNGGFSDTVTVSAPDTSALKLLISPATVTASCNSVTFDLKVKKKAPLGVHQVTFTGTDSKGNTATTSVPITVE